MTYPNIGEGATGIQGATGAFGKQGRLGHTGIQGTTGILGVTGLSGAVGEKGVTGIEGILPRKKIEGYTSVTLSPEDKCDLTLESYSSYAILSLKVNADSRIQIYTSPANRINDENRNELTEPPKNKGIVCDEIIEGNIEKWFMPVLIGYNENRTRNMELRITNKSTENINIHIEITLLRLENDT